MHSLSPELAYTALTAAFTGLLWVPIILNRVLMTGLWPTFSDPQPDASAGAAWATRLVRAHRNAIENLAVFAPLAIAVQLSSLSSAGTALACALFFAARVAHALLYVAGVPVLRTLAFLLGFGCQVMLALRLFGLA